MVAGTGNWNSKGESLEPMIENNCALAAFIASLVALMHYEQMMQEVEVVHHRL
jgi:hypothetical protein